MKRLLILGAQLWSSIAFAQLSPGDAVPDLNFATLLNARVKNARLTDLKGKLVLLDFWATWCGSCLETMPHLKALQDTYAGKLQIIAVNNETVKRTRQYLQARPANFWFAVDTSQQISALFPHQLIPHDILIDSDGRLIVTTSPELITNAVIDSLLAGQKVHIAEKKDNLLSYDDLIKQDFYAADTVQDRFVIQGEIKGSSGLSTTWLEDNAFRGRRLTCINLPLSSLYMIAYDNYPYSRTTDQTNAGRDASVYCLDLIVKSSDQLLPSLQKELAKRFDLQAKVEPMLKEVQILRITDTSKFNTLTRNRSGQRTYYARHGEIDQQSITMSEFAQFLEDYGVGKLVTDETMNKEKFDIKFSFQPENPKSLADILNSMGLSLTKAQRTVDILVLFKL